MRILKNPEEVIFEEPGVYVVAESEEIRISLEITEEYTSVITVDSGRGTLPIDELVIGSTVEAEQMLEDLILQYGEFKSYDEYLEALEEVEEFSDEFGDVIEIDDRETEINAAMEDFIDTLLYKAQGKRALLDDDYIVRAKRLIGIMLYQEYGVSIFDPCIMENENGETGIERYPYSNLWRKKFTD